MRKEGQILPDKGWAWVVLASCFISMALVDGIINSFGILYLELLDYFGESRSATSWVGALLPGIQGISGPFASALINKFGCRSMTILGSIISAAGFFCASFATNIWMLSVFYGIFGGVGFSLIYISGFVIISRYFEKRRAFAMGLSSCGSGVGTFIFAPLTSRLLETFGWRGGLWILSAIVLHGIACGSVYREGILTAAKETETSCPNDEKFSIENDYKTVEQQKKDEQLLLDFSLLYKPTFMIFCIATFMVFIGNFIPYVFLPDYARTFGIGRKQAAFLPSIIGISNTVGRLLCGMISDRKWADPLKIFSAALITGGIATACVSTLTTFPLLACYAVVFGLSIGAYVSLFAVILVELLGLHSLSSALGFVSVFCGTAALSGPPIAGAMFDRTGDYSIAFYVAGTCVGVAGFLMLPLRLTAKWKFDCISNKECVSRIRHSQPDNSSTKLCDETYNNTSNGDNCQVIPLYKRDIPAMGIALNGSKNQTILHS